MRKKAKNGNFSLQDVADWFKKKKITEYTGLKPLDCYNWGVANEWGLGGSSWRRKYKNVAGACVYYIQYVKGFSMGAIKQLRISQREEGIVEHKPCKDQTIAPAKKKTSTVKQKYHTDLKDQRWKAFREFIFTVRGCKCEKCGSEEALVVHHGTCEKPIYHRGYSHPWEYNCNEVVVLCNSCHNKLHNGD